MGRLLKRVPLDFDWPLNSIWKGYINPFNSVNCPYCYDDVNKYSDGLTKESRKYRRKFYGYQNNWHYLTHPYRPNERYCPLELPYNMEKWEYDFLVSDENEYRDEIFGNGGEIPPYEDITDYFLRNKWAEMQFSMHMDYLLTQEYCRRNGYEYLCPHCNGDGRVWYSEEVKNMSENFKNIEPPIGDGYQLWEDTSEGSPQSPVFATLDELCKWCEDNASTFGDYTATKEEWKQMLTDGFVHHTEGNVIFM